MIVHACIHTYTCIHIQTYIPTCIHTYIQYIPTHTYQIRFSPSLETCFLVFFNSFQSIFSLLQQHQEASKSIGEHHWASFFIGSSSGIFHPKWEDQQPQIQDHSFISIHIIIRVGDVRMCRFIGAATLTTSTRLIPWSCLQRWPSFRVISIPTPLRLSDEPSPESDMGAWINGIGFW